MSTLVCIPAFNEERFIGKLIKNCLKYADQVVVCDDGSVDNTYEVADAAGANVIRHEKNCELYFESLNSCCDISISEKSIFGILIFSPNEIKGRIIKKIVFLKKEFNCIIKFTITSYKYLQ